MRLFIDIKITFTFHFSSISRSHSPSLQLTEMVQGKKSLASKCNINTNTPEFTDRYFLKGHIQKLNMSFISRKYLLKKMGHLVKCALELTLLRWFIWSVLWPRVPIVLLWPSVARLLLWPSVELLSLCPLKPFTCWAQVRVQAICLFFKTDC